MSNRCDEKVETFADWIFFGSKITADGDCSHEIQRFLFLGRKAMTNLDSVIKSREITLLTKVHLVKAIFFSSSQVWMWELDHNEGWAPKNWYFQIMVLEKTLKTPLYSKIKLINPKRKKFWIFIGSTDAEAEAPILKTLDRKNWLAGKNPDAGKDWGQEKKEATEDKVVGWHHYSIDMRLSKLYEIVKDREAYVLQSIRLKRSDIS